MGAVKVCEFLHKSSSADYEINLLYFFLLKYLFELMVIFLFIWYIKKRI